MPNSTYNTRVGLALRLLLVKTLRHASGCKHLMLQQLRYAAVQNKEMDNVLVQEACLNNKQNMMTKG